jgi:hypothetical protein
VTFGVVLVLSECLTCHLLYIVIKMKLDPLLALFKCMPKNVFIRQPLMILKSLEYFQMNLSLSLLLVDVCIMTDAMIILSKIGSVG